MDKNKKILEKLTDAAVNIKMNCEQDKAFLTRHLVQVTLPHSNPGEVPAWKRTNGNVTLVIRPGWDSKKDQPIGYPYGTIPRLLLFWITTEALRTGSRRIYLSESLSSFMREIGLNPNTGGGKRGDAQRLRDQMNRLFRATISFESKQTFGDIKRERWLDMQVAPKGEFWWDFKKIDQSVLFGSWIELGEDFYNAIISAPVPLDIRALVALKGSSLALDVYAWATYKAFSLQKTSKEEQFITWKVFMKQLGVDYTDSDNFTRKCKRAFLKVQTVYPALQVKYYKGGFSIKSSNPSVTYKTAKRKHKPVDNPYG